MKICRLTFVIPELFYRESGVKPDSRLRHAGMTDNIRDNRVKHVRIVTEILRWAEGYLRQREVHSPYLDAEYILAHILRCKRMDLLIHPDRVLKDDEVEQFNACVERRGRREPLQYITGEVEFRGLIFKVSKDVLIPRPETELLVDEVVKVVNSVSKKGATVLDLCTGSGCIAVCIARELNDSKVYAVDISADALAVARENAIRHATGERITFLSGDLFGAIDPLNLKGKFDIIVSNPPYVSAEEMEVLQPEVKNYEPESALYGGEDGLDFYRRIIHESPYYLADGGYLVMEVGYRQAWRIKDLLEEEKVFGQIAVIKDLNGIDRIVKTSPMQNFY